MNQLQLPQNNQKKKLTTKEIILLVILVPIGIWMFLIGLPKDNDSNTNTIGTRENPAPIGKTVYYDGYIKNLLSKDTNTLSLRLTVTDVVRGEEALKIVENASKYNDLPEDGEEYVLVKVKIKLVKLTDDKKYTVSIYDFDFTTKDGAVLGRTSVSGLKPELSDLYEGGLTEGYVCCIVPSGTPLLLSWEDGERWFSLETDYQDTSETEQESFDAEDSADVTETTAEENNNIIDM